MSLYVKGDITLKIGAQVSRLTELIQQVEHRHLREASANCNPSAGFFHGFPGQRCSLFQLPSQLCVV